MDLNDRADVERATRAADELSEYLGEVEEYIEVNVAPLLETDEEGGRSTA